MQYVFAYLKKKQYLCSRFWREDSGHKIKERTLLIPPYRGREWIDYFRL